MADIERTVPYAPAVILKPSTCCTAPVVGPLPPDGYIPCDDIEPDCGGGDCTCPPINVENPIHGDGSEATPLGLTLDPAEDNILVINEEGLYAPPPTLNIHVENPVTGDGSEAEPLGVALSAEPDNTLQLKSDGLYNPPGSGGGGCSPGPGPYVVGYQIEFNIPNGGMDSGSDPITLLSIFDGSWSESPDLEGWTISVHKFLDTSEPQADWMHQVETDGIIHPAPNGYSELSMLLMGGYNRSLDTFAAEPADLGANPDYGYFSCNASQQDGFPVSPQGTVFDVHKDLEYGFFVTSGQTEVPNSIRFNLVQRWWPCGEGVYIPPPPTPLGLYSDSSLG